MPSVSATVTTPDGTCPVTLHTPEGSGPWPGVVVVHEIFGLTGDIRKQADRFARNGYLALAPDLYAWGNTARCLVRTLRTWLAHHGGWEPTAAELGVHRNSVRHRIAQVERALEVDLADPEVRMRLWFALRWASPDAHSP